MVHTIIAPRPGGASPDNDAAFESDRENLHRQMLSSVSHDLKTPLASIIGALEVFQRMSDKLSSERKATLIEVALQESYRLDNFITNILDMARLENRMVKPNIENVEINAIIKSCILKLDSRLKGSRVSYKPCTPHWVMTDPVLLSRTICLVLDNAAKFGGTESLIVIECGTIDSEYSFVKVRDQGKGVPESQKEIIFSKYTRFAREDQQNAGTGLGLAISREIMKLLRGDIVVHNNENSVGATFTITFPLR